MVKRKIGRRKESELVVLAEVPKCGFPVGLPISVENMIRSNYDIEDVIKNRPAGANGFLPGARLDISRPLYSGAVIATVQSIQFYQLPQREYQKIVNKT